MEQHRAERLIRHGVNLGIIVCLLQTMVLVILTRRPDLARETGMTVPLVMACLTFTALMTCGLHMRSRLCALAFVTAMLADMVKACVEGRFPALILSTLFLIIFVRALMGTVAWHRQRGD
ncbi:hypothetical protein JXA47_03005 [Candidatus Sumerlaeota bacterium]|nr:hypothetical protein [Candidatus Sumerlaeota bacterium]